MYVLSNGRSYLGKAAGNTLQTVPELSRAATWKNETAARNVLATLPRTLRNLQYQPVFIPDTAQPPVPKTTLPDTPQPAEAKPVESVPAVRPGIAPAAAVIETIAQVQACQTLLRSAGTLHAHYVQSLDSVEREILDIEHKIEFDKLNAAEGYRMYKLLHDARIRRRECKDMISLLYAVSSATPQDWLDGKPGHLANSMLSRSYVPRQLPDLFT